MYSSKKSYDFLPIFIDHNFIVALYPLSILVRQSMRAKIVICVFHLYISHPNFVTAIHKAMLLLSDYRKIRFKKEKLQFHAV